VIVAGIDVGSTYTKAVLLGPGDEELARAMVPTGFRLEEAARLAVSTALDMAGLPASAVAFTACTGYGRNQISFRDLKVTDLTAQGRAARHLFPGTQTVLDVGGQTMKAIRLDDDGWVYSFRLNDKCAAGTGAFLEKTARYLGYATEQIGPLAAESSAAVPISGVCAVFAESEVINHLSQGVPAADIMYGAMVSLVDRSVQLMRRVRMEPEFTVLGGILRFPSMRKAFAAELNAAVNIPEGDLPQYSAALGAALLGRMRLERIRLEAAA
jgi:predicted CoA-substrate-specific enzyme activase